MKTRYINHRDAGLVVLLSLCFGLSALQIASLPPLVYAQLAIERVRRMQRFELGQRLSWVSTWN